ncbi:MAG: hypothetical protein F6K21_05555 [Symploca sp. SIO2D2]|nr:hypothetical protein [Symploca sp. SIO2D2]
MSVNVNVVVIGSPDLTNLNNVGSEIYAVWDGSDFVFADGTNNDSLMDIALAFLADDETEQADVKILEARLQSQRPNEALAIITTSRTTNVPTGKTIAVAGAAPADP